MLYTLTYKLLADTALLLFFLNYSIYDSSSLFVSHETLQPHFVISQVQDQKQPAESQLQVDIEIVLPWPESVYYEYETSVIWDQCYFERSTH